MSKIILKTLVPFMFLFFLSGCLKSDDSTGPSATEVENEVTGSIFLADGTPAIGAKVRMYPVGFSPKIDSSDNNLIYLAVTDNKGVFQIDSLKPGEYNMISTLRKVASYSDSILVTARTRVLPPDSLKETGSIKGIVQLQPNHLLSTVTVEVLGTQYFANVDKSGVFEFPALPAGRYRIRVTTTYAEYTPLNSEFIVQAGTSTILADTLKPIFNGIPIVLGLNVKYDTLTGTAHVSWHSVNYSLFQDYFLYRDPSGALFPSMIPIARVSDTEYIDALFTNSFVQEDASFEYRVRAVDKSGNLGPYFGFSKVKAISPSTVKTFMDLKILDYPTQVTSINDTVKIVLQFENQTRLNEKLSWYLNSDSTPVRVRSQVGRAGVDTLTLVTPLSPKSIPITVKMKDDGGAIWVKNYGIEVVSDTPIASAGEDARADTSSIFKLHGSAQQNFGTIKKWEWDIGNTGVFVQTSGPDTQFTMPSSILYKFLCRLRVTDDDGLSSIDTIAIFPTSSKLINFPEIPNHAALLIQNNLLFVIGGLDQNTGLFVNSVFTYNLITKEKIIKANLPTQGHGYAKAIEYQGKIYLIGGANNPSEYTRGYNPLAISEMIIYDPLNDQWSQGTPMPFAFAPDIATIVRGKLYVVGSEYGNSSTKYLLEYNFDTQTWKRVLNFHTGSGINSAAVLDNKIYINANEDIRALEIPETFLPIFSVDEGYYIKSQSTSNGFHGSLIAYDGTLFRFDSKIYPTWNLSKETVYAYDLSKNIWSPRPPLLTTRVDPAFVQSENHVYMIGGDCSIGADDSTPCGGAELYTLPKKQ